MDIFSARPLYARAYEIASVKRVNMAVLVRDRHVSQMLYPGVRSFDFDSYYVNTIPYTLCDCFGYKSKTRTCSCKPEVITRHELDLIDMGETIFVEIEEFSPDEAVEILLGTQEPFDYPHFMDRISAARKQYDKVTGFEPAGLQLFKAYCQTSFPGIGIVEKIETISRSIAALAGHKTVTTPDMVESFQYIYRGQYAKGI